MCRNLDDFPGKNNRRLEMAGTGRSGEAFSVNENMTDLFEHGAKVKVDTQVTVPMMHIIIFHSELYFFN